MIVDASFAGKRFHALSRIKHALKFSGLAFPQRPATTAPDNGFILMPERSDPDMHRILIAFATTEGQTEKIAHHLARRFEDRGCSVRLVDCREPDGVAIEGGFDGVLLAGSLHVGTYQPELLDFARGHRELFAGAPFGFVSVSLTAAGEEAGERAAVAQSTDAFMEAAAIRADRVHYAAGAVHDSELNLVKRLALHAILAAKGVTPDPSGHTEFTDWPALDAFADEFLGLVRERRG
jgi:menaquinone-dependent protoporphyrinogen oxidase